MTEPRCPLCDGWGCAEENNCRICGGTGSVIVPFVKIGWSDGTVATWIISQDQAEKLDAILGPAQEIHMGGMP